MANPNSASDYLRPLALHFADHSEILQKELHKNGHWKKIMKLSTTNRYEIILIAFRGLVQRRNPGYDNRLWALLVLHDLEYMLQKGNTQFLYEITEEIKKVRDLNTLPFSVIWDVILNLVKHDFESCLYLLIENLLKKHAVMKKPSKKLQSFISKLDQEFQNINKSTSEELQHEIYHLHGSFSFNEENTTQSKWGKYFVDTQEQEEAWHRLDQSTKTVVQQYEEDLFYDRSPKPSKERKDKTIEAVQNSKLNKKHKKALIESIKKKG